MKKKIFSILFAVVLALIFSLLMAALAAASPGTTYYVDDLPINALPMLDGTVASYNHTTKVLVTAANTTSGYVAGDAIEFLSGNATGHVDIIDSISYNNSVATIGLTEGNGEIAAADTFNLVTMVPTWDADPFRFIQSAINVTPAGDTIMAAAGEYDAFVVEGKANMSIISTEGATVTSAVEVESEGFNWSMALVQASANITIDGINFDGTAVIGDEVVGIACVNSTGGITDLTVENITATESGVGVFIRGHNVTHVVNLSGVTVDSSMTGVYIWDAVANLDGCTITGTKGMNYTGIRALEGATVSVQNCDINNCWVEVPTSETAGTGIWIGNPDVVVEMTGSTISNNNRGIFVEDDGILEAHFNNIVGNDVYGVQVLGGNQSTVNATLNWWGHARGPYHPDDNINGAGDTVSNNVDFEPWLGAALVAVKTEPVTDGIVDAKDEANTDVLVSGNATVTVARYADNPGGDPPTGYTSVGTFTDVYVYTECFALDKYIDIYVPNTDQVTEIEIRLYYTDAELDVLPGVSEESLRLFWWDGTCWDKCSVDGINIGNTNGYSGYTWVRITKDTAPDLVQLTGTPLGGYIYPPPVIYYCFIATAAYGTPTAEQLDVLREFRDVVLLESTAGSQFVALYYQLSPPIAEFIAGNEILRTLVRELVVDPIVWIVKATEAIWRN